MKLYLVALAFEIFLKYVNISLTNFYYHMKDYTNSLKDLDINSDKNTTEILKLRDKYSIEENPDSPLSKIKELKKYVDEQEEKHLEKIKDYVQHPEKYNRTEFLLYQENYKIYMNSVKNELNESIENYKSENKIKFKP